MSITLPPLIWLRAFDAAARNGSFVGAAQELGVTPSAVSQQVRLLEERLGRPLFKRLPRGINLTEAGEAYRPVVQQAFESLLRGTDALFGRREKEGVQLRATASFQAHWLLPRITSFLDRHPAVPLRILTTLWASDFDQAAIDLEIRYGDGRWPGNEVFRLTEDYLEPFANPALAMAAKERDKGEWLSQQRLIEVIGYREGWQEWSAAQSKIELSSANAAPAVLEVDTVATAFALCEAGQGVALLRRWMAAAAVQSGRLEALGIGKAILASDSFYLLVPQGRRLSASARILRDWILEETAGHA
ncbi:LysR substrate-binding domain-containing protein [Limibacillus halophilus]|uniref:LysR family glycine cleavage system transcriptional activator n=1 Tax=Limibacillus halophilus TaxID=1579333 RepID=A0A839T0V1_9PROT|nr:LysR substrate-binding domain-containing protein [Limibacillus halophilus]MBB3066773.1 LysR family glycine cleavage system transcriptional activator [Limibacillus halophilus]